MLATSCISLWTAKKTESDRITSDMGEKIDIGRKENKQTLRYLNRVGYTTVK